MFAPCIQGLNQLKPKLWTNGDKKGWVWEQAYNKEFLAYFRFPTWCCFHLTSFIWSGLTCGFRLINIHETHTQSRTGTITDKFYRFVKQISPSSSPQVKQRCNIMLSISDVCHVVHIAVFKKPVSLIFPFGHTVNLVAKRKHLLHLCWNHCTEPAHNTALPKTVR